MNGRDVSDTTSTMKNGTKSPSSHALLAAMGIMTALASCADTTNASTAKTPQGKDVTKEGPSREPAPAEGKASCGGKH